MAGNTQTEWQPFSPRLLPPLQGAGARATAPEPTIQSGHTAAVNTVGASAQAAACAADSSGTDETHPAGARALEEMLQRHEERLFARIQCLVDKTLAHVLQVAKEKEPAEDKYFSTHAAQQKAAQEAAAAAVWHTHMKRQISSKSCEEHSQPFMRKLQVLADRVRPDATKQHTARDMESVEEPVTSEGNLSAVSEKTNRSLRSGAKSPRSIGGVMAATVDPRGVGSFMRTLEDSCANEFFSRERLTGRMRSPRRTPTSPRNSMPISSAWKKFLARSSPPGGTGSAATPSRSASQAWSSEGQVQRLADCEAPSQPGKKGGAAAAAAADPTDASANNCRRAFLPLSAGACAGAGARRSHSEGSVHGNEAGGGAGARRTSSSGPPSFQGPLPVPPPMPERPTPPPPNRSQQLKSSAAGRRPPWGEVRGGLPPTTVSRQARPREATPTSPYSSAGSADPSDIEEQFEEAPAKDVSMPAASASHTTQKLESEMSKRVTALQSLVLQSDVSSPCNSERKDDVGFMGMLRRGSNRLVTSVSSTVCAANETQNVRLAIERDAIQELEDLETGSSAPGEEEPPIGHLRSETEQWSIASPLLLRAWGVLLWDRNPQCDLLDSERSGDSASGGLLQSSEQPGAGAGADARPCWRLRLKYAASVLYRRLLLAMALAALGLCVEQLVAHVRLSEGSKLSALSENFPLQDCVAALGGLLGLLCLRGLAQHRLLGQADSLLVRYARKERIEGKWSSVSFHQSVSVVALWALAVAARAASVVIAEQEEGSASVLGFNRQTLHVGIFAFSSGLLASLTYCVLHIASGLVLMVDTVVLHFLVLREPSSHVRTWNTLQCVIRQACRRVERGLLVLLTAVFALVLIVVVDLSTPGRQPQYPKLLTVMALAAMVARLCLKAAEVTEKCTRMPSLINGVGNAVDPYRHYLVEYVEYSAAGFYVKEVRITTATVLKAAYVSGLAIFALLRWTIWSLP